MQGCSANYKFTFKVLMQELPNKFALTILISSLVWFSQALRIAESPLTRTTNPNSDFNFMNMGNSLWCVAVTMTTVGFGDVYPRSGLGKAIMFVCALEGVILASIYVVALTNSLKMT
jgi:voltage-gated potassium channel